MPEPAAAQPAAGLLSAAKPPHHLIPFQHILTQHGHSRPDRKRCRGRTVSYICKVDQSPVMGCGVEEVPDIDMAVEVDIGDVTVASEQKV